MHTWNAPSFKEEEVWNQYAFFYIKNSTFEYRYPQKIIFFFWY